MGPCALGDVSGRVVNLVADQASKKGVDLAVRDGLDNDTCTADANQLTQVLLNLVINAVDVCEKGDSIEITLSREEDESDRSMGYARIDVSDSGPGVPEEIRGTLFDPFVTTKTNGTGLGLAISQQIVEEHNGDIRCEFLKRGTRFTIRLPLDKKRIESGGGINRPAGER
jgi:signal transduction histidine kinase